MKLLERISDVNINPTKFQSYHVQKLHFHRTGYLGVFRLFLPIIYRPDELCQKKFWILCLPRDLTGKNFMIIRSVVCKILEVTLHPLFQVTLSCQKLQTLFTVKTNFNHFRAFQNCRFLKLFSSTIEEH